MKLDETRILLTLDQANNLQFVTVDSKTIKWE